MARHDLRSRSDTPTDGRNQSHYFRADLPAQFDAVMHFDRTTAVQALEWSASWGPDELPETYPTAL